VGESGGLRTLGARGVPGVSPGGCVSRFICKVKSLEEGGPHQCRGNLWPGGRAGHTNLDDLSSAGARGPLAPAHKISLRGWSSVISRGTKMLLCFAFTDTTWHLQIEAKLGLCFNHQPCKRQRGEFRNVLLVRKVCRRHGKRSRNQIFLLCIVLLRTCNANCASACDWLIFPVPSSRTCMPPCGTLRLVPIQPRNNVAM
jgi:hypothetical protein